MKWFEYINNKGSKVSIHCKRVKENNDGTYMVELRGGYVRIVYDLAKVIEND